jgi:hypothetical protein
MSTSSESARLDASVKALRGYHVVPGVAATLRERAEAMTKTLLDVIVREVPAFTTTGNPDVMPELEQHLQLHINEVCRLLEGLRMGDFAFVRDHARQRAGQKFPLDAVLSSYRSIHRGLNDWIRDAALESADDSAQLRSVVAAVNDFVIDYIGLVATLITSEYVLHTRVVAEAEGDRRTELLNMLLSGFDESDSRAAQLLSRGGYLEQRQTFCVAVARSVDPREMESAARAQRMADAVTQALRNVPVRVLIGIRDNLVTIVLSGTRRQSGWTAPQSLLAERVYPHLRTIGPAALIGLSTDAPSTSHIPAALIEARHALDFAHVAERVMPFARIPFRNMLVRVAAEQIRSALPSWVESFLVADEKSRGSLTSTLRAYADANMNVLKTAELLSLHPNTIYARMHRIVDITERNPLRYAELTELLLATDCARARSGTQALKIPQRR